MGAKTYFGLPLEPKAGICLGAYAEGDKKIHNPSDPNKFYMDTFPGLAGREMSAYLLYMTYGEDNLSKYESHFKKAVKKGKVMQIALQPMNGLSAVVENDPYLIKLAKDMEFVRVDLYVHGGKVYFGELTFYPAGGYTPITPREWDKKLGEQIRL